MFVGFCRALLNKRPVQLLILITFVLVSFASLPRSEPGHSLFYFNSASTRTETDSAEPDRDYEAALVVASQSKDNTTWLQGNFPAWRKSIYVVDDPQAALPVPVNKGRESMVYLTYMIDNYEKLENVTIFVHAEQYQWHNDDPDYNGERNLARLNISHIQNDGYANLRCAWILGCPAEIHPLIEAGRPSSPPKAGEVYKDSFGELFPGVEVPKIVGSACCAQIAVSKEAIRSRPKEDYTRFRQWIIDTDLEDDLSGRVLEYSWHIIFGKDAVFCPDAQECYCNLYGLCNLECNRKDSCKGRYTLPKYSTLPEGWPDVDWDGQWRQINDY